MMLSSLPSSHKDDSDSRPQADAPLHERLFGEHSTWFYVGITLWITVMLAMLIFSAVYAPHRLPQAIGSFALPIFCLLGGSPSRRMQAVPAGIMGSLIWSYLQVGPLRVAAAGLATGLAAYVCAEVIHRELAALTGQTRRQRLPTLARLISAVVVACSLVAVPGALVVHGYLTGRGWSPETAAYLVAGGLAILGAVVYHKVADEIPGTVDG